MRISISLAALGAVLLVPAAGAPPVKITVPAGYKVSTFATGLQHPTAMAWGPDGRLYVTEDTGLVVVARPGRKPLTVAAGLRTPLGLAWRGQELYVSEQGRLGRYTLAGTKLTARKILVRGLPFGLHQQDTVAVGPGDRLYLGSGSTCDACRDKNPRSAAVLSLKPDGTDVRVVARGLRNPFGLAFQPGTDKLYASVNGQDKLGTKAKPEPAEMVVRVQKGGFYGWPRCWPSYAKKTLAGRCRGVTPPVAYLEPHSSADGLAFWRGDLFVALWGQYLSNAHGRKLVRIHLGPPKRVTTFARGFDHPLALVVDEGGALLVADWGRGVIYRISAAGASAVGSVADSGATVAAPCRSSNFSVDPTGPISEPTGQHTLTFTLRNHGTACSLFGYPRVAFFDRTGKLPFGIWHGGDQVVTPRRPARLVIRPGRAAYVALNKYRCDLGNVRAARTLRLGFPRTVRQSFAITVRPRGWIQYCGRDDPGSGITVSPFEPSLRAAMRHW